ETASALQLLFGHAVNSDDNRITLYTVESTDAEGNTVHKLALGLGDNAALQDNIAQLVPGQPYHVALTWDGTTYAVFVDGVRRDAGTFSGLAELEAFADVGNFGTASGRAYASGFRGLVDEIQLYRRALNAEEITRLFLTHTAKENRLIEFAVYGTDDAGNPIYYTAKNLPAGATFDAQKQTFFWRPALYQSAGNYEIVFAADGYPDQKITVSVQDTELAGWYIKFLESRGLH
ncbi:MAG: LamG domain-containing protein, partial [Planctomycetes bacterium]|nr:LamG domain-containing protein [Planctomycetota bacterium]